jgi:hypothetical protein
VESRHLYFFAPITLKFRDLICLLPFAQLRPSRLCRGFSSRSILDFDFAFGFAPMTIPEERLLDYFHRTFRQRLHKRAAVGSGDDAIVEDDDNAAVALRPD